VARAFAAEGDRLALLARRAEELEALVAGLPGGDRDRYLPLAVDLTSATDAGRAAATVRERLGPAEVLLHLVGVYKDGTGVDPASAETLPFVIDVNFWTAAHALRAFLPQVTAGGRGRIVTVSSVFAQAPTAGSAAYAAAKAALEALTLGLARQVAGSGTTANVIVVRSIKSAAARAAATGREAAAWTTPEEVAAAMRWLCSDEAAAVNGVRLPLYGRG
jgi:3-oxoacyl-[acyl-carrier protein] reductase